MKLRKLQRKGNVIDLTNEEVKHVLGLDLNIRTLYMYMQTIGMTYDYKLKVWRKVKPKESPRKRYVTKLQEIYKRLGLKFVEGQVLGTSITGYEQFRVKPAVRRGTK